VVRQGKVVEEFSALEANEEKIMLRGGSLKDPSPSDVRNCEHHPGPDWPVRTRTAKFGFGKFVAANELFSSPNSARR